MSAASSRWLGGVVVIAMVAAAVAVACGDTEPPDVPPYGPPGGLPASGPDTPTEDAGAPSSSSSGGSSSGGGGGDAGTTTGPTYACVTAGGTIVDGGPCSVSWTNDIWPAMEATGAWTCASSSCHAVTPPLMPSAAAAYTNLANFTSATVFGNSNPYFNPCSTTATQSNFVCNTASTGTCGNQMPLSATIVISDAGLAKIATWVGCGAPNN